MQGNDVTVYVVEDSLTLAKLLGELIESTGAKVVGYADTGARAIDDIARLRPDAVTIDITLKRGSGFDVLQALETGDTEHATVRIVLSNHLADTYRSTASCLGADYFFDKATELREAVDLIASLKTRTRRQRIGA